MSDDIFQDYVNEQSKKNEKIKENEMEKSFFDGFKNIFKDFLASSNAAKLSMIMFYTLLVLGEARVFEASMLLTKNNVELSLSVLLVTGISAACAERAGANPKATKNQRILAYVIWIVNLVMAALFGFMAFALAGRDLQYDITLLPGITFNIASANTILFALVSALTIFEILAYHTYTSLDIDIAAKRKMARLFEAGRKADLDLVEAKQTQSINIKKAQESSLALVEEKLNTIKALNERYGGKVPQNILDDVIGELTGFKNVSENNQSRQNQTEPEQPKQKRPYIRKQLTQSESEENNNLIPEKKDEVKDENFTKGEESPSDDGWGQ